MRRAALAGILSTLATYASAPRVRRYLVAHNAYDIPNNRSSHKTPVPRGGGLACIAGIAVAAVAAADTHQLKPRTLAAIGSLAFTGFIDDRSGHLHPALRLAAQAIAGAAMNRQDLKWAPAPALATAATVNAVNFMDGINGITGGTVAACGINTLVTGHATNDPALRTLGAITAGTAIGFLPWNWKHPQLFLGDVGSYLMGGLLAAAITQAAPNPQSVYRLASPMIPYGVDTGQALLRHAWDRKPLTQAHRDHIYQRLVDEHRLRHETVAACYTLLATGHAIATHFPRHVAPLAHIGLIGLQTTLPRLLVRLKIRGQI